MLSSHINGNEPYSYGIENVENPLYTIAILYSLHYRFSLKARQIKENLKYFTASRNNKHLKQINYDQK